MYERLSSGAGAAAWCASRSRCCSRPCCRSLGVGSCFFAAFLGMAVLSVYVEYVVAQRLVLPRVEPQTFSDRPVGPAGVKYIYHH